MPNDREYFGSIENGMIPNQSMTSQVGFNSKLDSLINIPVQTHSAKLVFLAAQRLEFSTHIALISTGNEFFGLFIPFAIWCILHRWAYQQSTETDIHNGPKGRWLFANGWPSLTEWTIRHCTNWQILDYCTITNALRSRSDVSDILYFRKLQSLNDFHIKHSRNHTMVAHHRKMCFFF